MEFLDIKKEVKNQIINELVKRLDDIVEPIIFPKNVDRVDDTSDNECFNLKPYVLYLEENEYNEVDIQFIYSYYDNVFYDSLGLSKNHKYRKGNTVRNTLSVFNVTDIINIIYKIPKRYKINLNEFFNNIKSQLCGYIKDKLIETKEDSYRLFDRYYSFIVPKRFFLEVDSLHFKNNEIFAVYRKFKEDEVFENIAWIECNIKDFDLSEIISIADLIQRNLENE